MNDQTIQEHRSGDSFELDGKWITPCTCGKRFTSTTPSLAYGRWKRHAAESSPKPVVTPPAGTPARAKVCGCGCSDPLAPRAGGLFRSGHDARFKSVLTAAHSAGQQVRHPLTGEETDAIVIAAWLDERRGGGSFWQEKVLAGHKPAPARQPRTSAATSTQVRGVARVDLLMTALATRRPAAGDVGVVTLRSGQSYGAQVLRRENDTALAVRIQDGPERGKQIVIADAKFTRPTR